MQSLPFFSQKMIHSRRPRAARDRRRSSATFLQRSCSARSLCLRLKYPGLDGAKSQLRCSSVVELDIGDSYGGLVWRGPTDPALNLSRHLSAVEMCYLCISSSPEVKTGGFECLGFS